MLSTHISFSRRFINACRTNDIDEVHTLLKKDGDISSAHFATLRYDIIETELLALIKQYRKDYWSSQNQIAMKIVVALLNHRDMVSHLSTYQHMNIINAVNCIIGALFQYDEASNPIAANIMATAIAAQLRTLLDIRLEKEKQTLLTDKSKLLSCLKLAIDYYSSDETAPMSDTILYIICICIKNNISVSELSLEQKIRLSNLINDHLQSTILSTAIFRYKFYADLNKEILADMQKNNPDDCKVPLNLMTWFIYVTKRNEKINTDTILSLSETKSINDYLLASMSHAFKTLNADFSVALAKLKQCEKPFFDRLNLQNILLELEKLISSPHNLDQGNRSLCGMASFCVQLLQDEPHMFLRMAIDLLCDGKTTTPIPLIATPELVDQSDSVSDFVLQTLRHNLNVILPYHSNTLHEGILGCTRPKELVELLKVAGYDNIRETTIAHTTQDIEIPSPFRAAMGGLYSDYHHTFKNRTDNLDYVIEQMKQHPEDSVIFLLRMPLIQYIIHGKPLTECRNNLSTISFFIPVEFTHFLNVNDLKINKDGLITIGVSTYGQKIYSSLTKEALAPYFDGAIIARSPSVADKALTKSFTNPMNPIY